MCRDTLKTWDIWGIAGGSLIPPKLKRQRRRWEAKLEGQARGRVNCNLRSTGLISKLGETWAFL